MMYTEKNNPVRGSVPALRENSLFNCAVVATTLVLFGCAANEPAQPQAEPPVTEVPAETAVAPEAGQPAAGPPEPEAKPVGELAATEPPPADATVDGAGPEVPAEPSRPEKGWGDVRWIQERLLELGYYTGPVDGRVGKATRGAIRSYEEDQGLDPTGSPTVELQEFMWRNGG